MEGQDVKTAVAVIDNGKFGKREIRFETGRLARQAAGAALVYLDDDSMLLSATTASKKPKDQFDFFPLTVDVEENGLLPARGGLGIAGAPGVGLLNALFPGRGI